MAVHAEYAFQRRENHYQIPRNFSYKEVTTLHFIAVISILYCFACVGYCSTHLFCIACEWLLQAATALHRWTHKAKPRATSNSIISYSAWMQDFEVRR